MTEIRGGFSKASLVACIALVLVVGYLIWSATKKTDTENYGGKATHIETTIAPVEHAYPLCCARFIIQPDGSYIDPRKDKKK